MYENMPHRGVGGGEVGHDHWAKSEPPEPRTWLGVGDWCLKMSGR